MAHAITDDDRRLLSLRMNLNVSVSNDFSSVRLTTVLTYISLETMARRPSLPYQLYCTQMVPSNYRQEVIIETDHPVAVQSIPQHQKVPF